MSAMYPQEHEVYNSKHYPGTRQLCVMCNVPTERCEEDTIYMGDFGPYCETCYEKMVSVAPLMLKAIEFIINSKHFDSETFRKDSNEEIFYEMATNVLKKIKTK